MQHTLAICKPGVLQRKILGEIITRIENKGFQIQALKLMQIPKSTCEKHYAEHAGKEFFTSLVAYMTSAPVVVMVLAGEEAIARLRLLCGATKVEQSAPGTIRGDFATQTQMNIIHASDSPMSAEREINLYFKPEEILCYDETIAPWI